jgi:hypothetical protein
MAAGVEAPSLRNGLGLELDEEVEDAVAYISLKSSAAEPDSVKDVVGDLKPEKVRVQRGDVRVQSGRRRPPSGSPHPETAAVFSEGRPRQVRREGGVAGHHLGWQTGEQSA